MARRVEQQTQEITSNREVITKHRVIVSLISLLALFLFVAQVDAGQCKATTQKGNQCKRQASPDSDYCWQHGGSEKSSAKKETSIGTSSSGKTMAGEFKVTRVPDGDTINVRSGSSEMTIRLVGIDAPELSHKKRETGQPFSQQATKHLAGLVLNESVGIKEHGHDRYGRILGVVYLGGKNVNLEMVKAGYAEVYRGNPAAGQDLAPYWKAEEMAKAAKKGMWSLGTKYISPREWRRSHSEK